MFAMQNVPNDGMVLCKTLTYSFWPLKEEACHGWVQNSVSVHYVLLVSSLEQRSCLQPCMASLLLE